jgi:hypothetical protein
MVDQRVLYFSLHLDDVPDGAKSTYQLIDVEGDGNCLYRSLCEAPQFTEYTHITLRNELVKRMRTLKETDAEAYKTLCFIYAQEQEPLTFNDVMVRISTLQTWGGNAEALTTMLLFDVNIVIHQAGKKCDGTLCFIFGTSKQDFTGYRRRDLAEKEFGSGTIHLLHHKYNHATEFCRPNHFGYLKPVSGITTGISKPVSDKYSTDNAQLRNVVLLKRTDGMVDSPITLDDSPKLKRNVTTDSKGSVDYKETMTAKSELTKRPLELDDDMMKGQKKPLICYKGLPRGTKKGSTKNHNITVTEWCYAATKYINLDRTMSQASFLRSDLTSEKFTDSASHRQSFSRWINDIKSGKCKGIEEGYSQSQLRRKSRPFLEVEKKLVAYLNTRAQRYYQDKIGVSWEWLKKKCNEWAASLQIEKWNQCTDGWLHNSLKRHGFEHTKLYGEASELTDEQVETLMAPWRVELAAKISDLGCSKSEIYNADQTGLLFQKLPNCTYLHKDKKKDAKGTKGMADKSRITLMVCTAASGDRVPMAVVGKFKRPACFSLVEKVPLAYTNQINAWFDQGVTLWWINNVFWPHHKKEKGDVPCILLLDNCTAHNIDKKLLISKNIHIIFFPKNVTNRHQPADMGIIRCIKVGYRMTYLQSLLKIFDEDGGFEQAAKLRAKQARGCKGLHYGGKPHILDAMNIVQSVWMGKDEHYMSEATVAKCWMKANILPANMTADFNDNHPGIVTELTSDNDESNCKQLCTLIKDISKKADQSNLDTSKSPVFIGSFVEDQKVDDDELAKIVDSWVEIEDDADVHESMIEAELTRIDNEAVGSNDEEETDMKEEQEDVVRTQHVFSHMEAMDAIDGLQTYLAYHDCNKDCMAKLSTIQHEIRRNHMCKKKFTPSIKTFFK